MQRKGAAVVGQRAETVAARTGGTRRGGLGVAGHFGEWLQGRVGPGGPVALVTLPCPALRVRVAVPGDALPFDAAALRGFLAGLGLKDSPLPALCRDMPLGGGAGASTATLVALARAMGFAGPPERLAAACLAVEGATDPLMFPASDTLLWASRDGGVLERFAPPPACAILGGFWGAPQRTDPDDADFPDIGDLLPLWRAATEAGDLPRIAALSTESAARCDALRGPGDPMAELARDLGAMGMVRAHTGSARGLVFAPGAVPRNGLAALTEAGLSGVLQFDAGAA